LILSLGFIAVDGIEAAGSKEDDLSDRPVIGLVHLTLQPTYFYQGIEYQSFYESYKRSWEALSEEYEFQLIEIEGGLEPGTKLSAVKALIDRDADAVLIYQHEPTALGGGGRIGAECQRAHRSTRHPSG
jgi:hypothetical protein